MKRYIKGLGLVALAGLVAAGFSVIKAAEAAEVVTLHGVESEDPRGHQ